MPEDSGKFDIAPLLMLAAHTQMPFSKQRGFRKHNMEKMRRRCYPVDGMVEPDRPLTEQELEELQQNLARLSEPSVKEVYRQVTTAMSLPTRCSVFPTRSGVRLPDEEVRKIEMP